jgi:succinate dehydrogenase/fumarate reductase flavoprotein subunit
MPFVDPTLPYEEILRETYDRVLDLETYGMKVRLEDGSFLWMEDGAILTMSADQKLRFAAQVRKLGVNVINYTQGTDLLTKEGAVVGATGLNIRNGKFTVCKAKATVLSTGKVTRLYLNPCALHPSIFAGWRNPACCGEGQAMAYRAGAELVNMEFARGGGGGGGLPLAGPRYTFTRSPSHCIPRDHPTVFDVNGQPLPHEYATLRGEAIAGKAPFYFDLTGLDEKYHKLWLLAQANEHPIVLKFMLQQGVDFRKDKVEFGVGVGLPNALDCMGPGQAGVRIDDMCRTSLKGLYGGGDMTGGHYYGALAGSFVFGARAGRFAAEYAKKAEKPAIDVEQVEAARKRVLAPLERGEGIHWLEFEKTIQWIVSYYVGIARSGPLIRRGLELLDQLKTRFMSQLKAANLHELMRCLEAQNIILTAETHMRAALERRESRHGISHYRIDYPETDNVNWGRPIVIKNVDGEMKLTLLGGY